MKIGFVGVFGKGVELAGNVFPALGAAFSTRWYFGATSSRFAMMGYFLDEVGRSTGAMGATGIATALGPITLPLVCPTSLGNTTWITLLEVCLAMFGEILKDEY